MLLLPLLSDLLLLNHDGVGALLVALVALFVLEQLILQVGNLDVALVIQLVNPSMEDNLQSVQLRYGTFLLITQLVDELSQTVVVVEVSLVVPHVRVQFDLLFVLENSGLLPFIFDSFELLLQLFVFALTATDFFFTHGLLLVDRFVVAFILYRRVLLECPPLVLQLGDFLTQ